jgi:site-specific recombinase XerD
LIPQCSHITKKRGVYYYRRRIPKTANCEVVLSLRTRVYRVAESIADGLDREFERLVQGVTTDDKADLNAVLRTYLKQRLDFDMWRRAETPHAPIFGAPQPGKSHASIDLEWIDHELATARSDLAARAYAQQRPLIDEVMEAHGVPEEHRNALAHGILRANVELWETVRRRTLGQFPSLDNAALRPIASSPPEMKSPAGPAMTEVLPAFLDYAQKDKGWRGQTLAQNKTSYRMFLECCGDRPPTTYVKTDLTKFYDLLRGLPQLYSKSRDWAGLTLEQIVERTKGQDIERLSMTTMKRHFSALGVFFAYLKRRGEYAGENPAYGFEFPTKGRARHDRAMWEGDLLSKLFASPVWTGCLSKDRRSRPGALILRDERYWLPLLGLYHGNRLEEFAQLHRSDVRCTDGIWYMDINDEGAKQLKNEQSKRRVPIHPVIQELGFMQYVTTTAPEPKDRLFPQLRPGGPDKKIGYYFTKWWTKYRKDIGVYQKKLDYHSFRGGVTTKLSAANISLDVRNELLGHEGQSIDQQNYLKGLPLRMLADAIACVAWPEVNIKKPHVLPASEAAEEPQDVT